MNKANKVSSLSIQPLSDHFNHIPLCAAWTFGEWGALIPDRTLEYYLKMFEEYANEEGIPYVTVAFDGDQPIGMAAIRDYDLANRDDLKPWLTLVYVHPSFRGQGVASALVNSIEQHASKEGFETIYLYTAGSEKLYADIGWSILDTIEDPLLDGENQKALIMSKQLTL